MLRIHAQTAEHRHRENSDHHAGRQREDQAAHHRAEGLLPARLDLHDSRLHA